VRPDRARDRARTPARIAHDHVERVAAARRRMCAGEPSTTRRLGPSAPTPDPRARTSKAWRSSSSSTPGSALPAISQGTQTTQASRAAHCLRVACRTSLPRPESTILLGL
jgi:hypothetical protein